MRLKVKLQGDKIMSEKDKNTLKDTQEGVSSLDDLDSEQDHRNIYCSSREIVEICLNESFSETGKSDLLSMIGNYFSKLSRKISDRDHIDDIIFSLIDYCLTNNELDNLWIAIEKVRPHQYKIFHCEWKRYIEIEQEQQYDGVKVHQYENFKNEQRRNANNENIVDWFFKNLDGFEQSVVITAALFQGIERNVFNELVQDVHSLLFPPEEIPPAIVKNEQQSDKNEENSKTQPKEDPIPSPAPRLKNEQEIIKKARIKFIIDKRNCDYGLTDVEVVIFEFSEYQIEILKLIKENLFSIKDELLSFIESLGNDGNAEKRLFSINAVIALSEIYLIQDLLDNIIRKWAKTDSYYTHQETALTLSGILLQERQQNEILSLLNGWLKINNRLLNIISMSTYYIVASQYPNESLCAMEIALSKGKIILSLKCIDIASVVYKNNKRLFISYLYRWIKNDRDFLCFHAVMYFFRFIKLNDTVADQLTVDKVVEIISFLWKEKKIPMRLAIQHDIAERIKAWAEEALLAIEHDDELFKMYQKFFYALHKHCKENMEYYLNKWQSYKDYEQKKAIERRESGKIQSSLQEQPSFFTLIQQGE